MLLLNSLQVTYFSKVNLNLFSEETEHAQMERIYEVVGDFDSNDMILND